MAYLCKKYLKTECDSCGACQPEPEFNCYACKAPIYSGTGDAYYDYGDRVYCSCCTDIAKETA